jgi:hypothetical protein
MQVSALSITESLKSHLFTYPALVDSLQQKDFDFLLKLETWMRTVEAILKNNNIAECAEIAGLRSKIIAPLYGDIKKGSVKKKQMQVAADALYEVQSIVFSVVKPYEVKVVEARDLLINLLNVVKQAGAIKFVVGDDFQTFINQVWTFFSSHEQLKPGTVKILTFVSQIDAIRIIAEEIDIKEWM